MCSKGGNNERDRGSVASEVDGAEVSTVDETDWYAEVIELTAVELELDVRILEARSLD